MREIVSKGILLVVSGLLIVFFVHFTDSRVVAKAVHNGERYVVSTIYTKAEKQQLQKELESIVWNHTPQKIKGLPEYLITVTVSNKITKVNSFMSSYKVFYLENTNSYIIEAKGKTKHVTIDQNPALYQLLAKRPD